MPNDLPHAGEPYKKLEPKAGERCIICDVPLTPDDVVLLVRGRRVPLDQAMVDSFLQNEAKFFGRLTPKGALFQENPTPSAGMEGLWTWIGIYVLAAMLFAGLSAYHAVSIGLSPMRPFLLGFFFLIAGYLYVRMRTSVDPGKIPKGLAKVPTTMPPAVCSTCGNTNHPTADRCLECGNKLQPTIQSEARRADPA
jgi:hypothetical protein